jgi:thioredoxin 1
MIKIIDYYTTWCAPCKNLASVLKEIEQEYENVVVEKIDIEKNPELNPGIKAVPYVIIEVDGEKKEDFYGYKVKAAIVRILEKYM